VPEDKIEIIPLGVNPTLRPLPQNEIEPILKKFGLEHKNYVLFVGTLQPRKNIPRLIDAFALLKKKGRIEDKLAIVGGKGWIWKPITDKIRSAGLGNEVRFLDYVDNDDLHKLYCGAKLLTLPALYEGFGLPPLEAMACGTPTVVSNVSSLPEVVGDAGVLVDPNSIESIAEGITRLVTDDRLRMELGAKSLVQAKKFSWEQTAQKTKYLYEALKS
jgi:glycosyltransferase involved in cell wall biosynthesis